MPDLRRYWDDHKVVIIAASVLILAVLMVGAVFLAPWLYALITVLGLAFIFLGGRPTGIRKIQYIGILVLIVGVLGLVVRQVNNLAEVGVVVVFVGFVGLLFAFFLSPRSAD